MLMSKKPICRHLEYMLYNIIIPPPVAYLKQSCYLWRIIIISKQYYKQILTFLP